MTSAPDIEFIVLPPNTQAKHITGSYGAVDVQYHRNVYEDEICAILHTPKLGDSGSGACRVGAMSGGKATSDAPLSTSSGSGIDSIKRSMLFGRKLGHMNAEFQVLLSTIDVFCNSSDTVRNIATYVQDRGARTSHSSIGYKRQRRLQRASRNEVIPIQLVTGSHSRTNCVIRANSMSSIIMCNELRSVLPPACFLDFIMQNVDCPQSIKDSMTRAEAKEERDIALGKASSSSGTRKV